MNRRRFVATAAAGAAALAGARAGAQVVDLHDAINKAGRQRMLSQRMAKSYLAIGQDVEPRFADRTLSGSMALFDRQLVELKAYAPAAEIRSTYARLEAAWSDYKTALVGTKPGREQAEAVMTLAGTVLRIANEGTGQLEKVSGKSLGKLVNMAGRQRMLSQRMAAFYFSACWGVQAAAATAEIAKARDEFVGAHQVLRSAPEATPEIRAELELADMQWGFFDAALRSLRPAQTDKRAMTNVFTTSERILQVMEGVTGMFSRASQA